MNKSQNPKSRRDVSDLIALVNEIIAYWRAIARRQFDAHPPADNGTFEQHWPRILDNFFFAETVRVAKALSLLSEGRDN